MSHIGWICPRCNKVLSPKHEICPLCPSPNKTPQGPIEINTFESLADTEKRAVIATLERCEGNRKAAAKRLRIGERTLYRKLKEYGLI